MAVSLDLLNDKTYGLRLLNLQKTGSARILQMSAFRIKTSEIQELLGSYDAARLTICADTIVLDSIFTFKSMYCFIFARNVESVNGTRLDFIQPTMFQSPWIHQGYSFIVGQPNGGELNVGQRTVPLPFPLPTMYHPKTGSAPLQMSRVNIPNPAFQRGWVDNTPVQPGHWNLLGQYAVNALRSSFLAGSWLIESEDAEQQELGWKMMEWVDVCCRPAGVEAPPEFAAEFAELAKNATGLLIRKLIAATSVARYVPVLSPSVYQAQGQARLDALKGYESDWNLLRSTQQITDLVGHVSNVLASQSGHEVTALNAEMDKIKADLKGLSEAGKKLGEQSGKEGEIFEKCWTDLRNKIASEHTKLALRASFEFVTGMFKGGVGLAKALTGDLSGLGNIVKGMRDIGQSMDTFLQSVTFPESEQALVSAARNLAVLQEQTARTFQIAAHAFSSPYSWHQELPSVATTLDVAWKTYQASVEGYLRKIEIQHSSAPDVLNAVVNLQASLRKIVIYGNAINDKVSACAVLMGRGAVVAARLRGASDVTAQWNRLCAQFVDEQIRRKVAIWLLELRMDAIKYSIMSTWFDYRHSVFYHRFREPPVRINMAMNCAALTNASATMREWMDLTMAGTAISGSPEVLEKDVSISLEFDVVRGAIKDSEVAIFTPAENGKKATLAWTIPFGSRKFSGQLPNNGKIAIWVQTARFYLKGVKPNGAHRVITTVSTSGSYVNGIGVDTHRFETFGLTGDYMYLPESNVISKEWAIDTKLVMKPALFSQWTMEFDADGGDPSEISKLTMDLKVTYLRGNTLTIVNGMSLEDSVSTISDVSADEFYAENFGMVAP